jgi:hypothetical protein
MPIEDDSHILFYAWIDPVPPETFCDQVAINRKAELELG